MYYTLIIKSACRLAIEVLVILFRGLVVAHLPSLASEVGMDEFMKRMDTLKQVHNAWAHGGSVIVFDEDLRIFGNSAMRIIRVSNHIV